MSKSKNSNNQNTEKPPVDPTKTITPPDNSKGPSDATTLPGDEVAKLAPTKTGDIVVPEGENPLVDPATVSPLVDPTQVPEGAPVFELAFDLGSLAENLDYGLLTVQKAIDERVAPEGVEFPEWLVGYVLNGKVLERYVAGVNAKNIPLDEVELVIADPATDPTLKALNFSRYLQGLTDTHLYLRFL